MYAVNLEAKFFTEDWACVVFDLLFITTIINQEADVYQLRVMLLIKCIWSEVLLRHIFAFKNIISNKYMFEKNYFLAVAQIFLQGSS